MLNGILLIGLVAVACQSKSAHSMSLAADPETFVPGVTYNLTLSCFPGETVSQLSMISVFQLSRDGALLATGKPSGVILNDLRTSKYSAMALIDPNKLNSSFLLFTIQFPETEDEGIYKCQMNYEDQGGLIAIADSTVTLKQNVSGNNLSVQQQMEQTVQELDNLMIRTNNLEAQVFALNTVNSNLSRAIDQLSHRVSTHIGFFVTLSTSLLINEMDVVVFDTVLMNNGSGYNATSGVFTAPLSGFYVVNLVCEVEAQGSVRTEMLLQVNDTVVSKLFISGEDAAKGGQQSGSLVYDLPAGSEVKVVVGQFRMTSPDIPLKLLGDRLTYLSGYFLG